jgi:Na+-driven multidrug efflux pump
MAIVGRVMSLINSAMLGLGQGFQPVSSYNFGAKKYAHLRRGCAFTIRTGTLVLMRFFRQIPKEDQYSEIDRLYA